MEKVIEVVERLTGTHKLIISRTTVCSDNFAEKNKSISQ